MPRFVQFRKSLTAFFPINLNQLTQGSINSFAPELSFLQEIPLLFLSVLLINSCISIIGTSFIALRKSRLYFFQSILTGSRIFLLFPLLFLGAIGIFASAGLSVLFALLVLTPYIRKFGLRLGEFNLKFLKIFLLP